MLNRRVATVCCLALIAVGGIAQDRPNPSAAGAEIGGEKQPMFRAVAVRYQVKDVERSIEFYTKQLGFAVDRQLGPGAPFGSVSNGPYVLWLSGPGSSGARPMPDGSQQEPGGWNRLALEVKDLSACVAELKKESVSFRNKIEVGPGGKQIQVEDPDGNPIELFQPSS